MRQQGQGGGGFIMVRVLGLYKEGTVALNFLFEPFRVVASN